MPGRSDRDTMPYGSIISKRFYAPRRYIRIRNPRHPDRRYFDYGVIILPRPFSGIRKFMKVRSFSDAQLDEIRRTGLISVGGYPGDRPIGTLWRHTEFLRKIAPRRILYTVDTCPGHSGSPVWYRPKGSGEGSIIGVHTSGIIDELGRSYGCKKGAILAPPGMMNSGIRITQDVIRNISNPERRVAGVKPMVKLP